MKVFHYTITDPVGVHARPAGLLVKKAKEYNSIIKITKNEKSAEATKLMALMGLGIKQGDTIEVSVEGEDEETASASIEEFLKSNL